MNPVVKISRRSFLKIGAAAGSGLVLGVRLPGASTPAKLNAWVNIGADDAVTLFIHKAEMGQGTVTSLAMLLAEELECDWKKIRTEFPGISREYGPSQGVVGSMSIRSSWEPLRRAGAAAREMLVEAAAQQWGIDKAGCRAENSTVIDAAGHRQVTFGAVAEAASRLPVPPTVTLKDAAQFRVIGKPRKRLDTPAKVNGRAVFGIDVRRPGMLHAVVARCPVFGGKLAGFDDGAAKAVAGVKHVVAISTGLAVVADNTWSAAEGRRALKIRWDEGPTAAVDSAGIRRRFVEKAQSPGAVARQEGEGAAALAGAAKRIEAVYEVPYLAHAPMEPLNCVAEVRPDGCEVWASTQGQTAAQHAAAGITGLPLEKVQVHTKYMGGGFGRRARADYVSEAVETAKAVGVPVQLTWMREDDLQQDYYRPASYTRFSAGLDSEGWPVALTGRIVCPPFGGLREGVSRTGVEGIADMPYAIPNLLVDYHAEDPGIPVSYWRSVGYSQNTFFLESFIDELAAAAGKDAVEFRRLLLANSPRLVGVLDLAAERAGWGKAPADGRSRGVAVAYNVGSFNAQIAEVSVRNGALRVHRVVCAVDCGQVVNPAGVQQQIESGIVFGLTAALKGAITIDRGRVQQENFHQYDMLRIDEMPAVEVYLVPSGARPGGIGEASVPPIAPAVTNAIFAATGKRVRSLPIRV